MGERSCGTCSLCCKLTYIPELNKSIDTWCRHARPGAGGCSIYSERPTSCQSFVCGWLSGAREFGEEWFPGRCKMIVTRRVQADIGACPQDVCSCLRVQPVDATLLRRSSVAWRWNNSPLERQYLGHRLSSLSTRMPLAHVGRPSSASTAQPSALA
jgi:hypothetical protein